MSLVEGIRGRMDLRYSTPTRLTWVSGINAHLGQISIPNEHTISITRLILSDPVQLVGLAARDSLRLEAGMCLYGHDLDETTSPIEGNLAWVVGRSILCSRITIINCHLKLRSDENAEASLDTIKWPTILGMGYHANGSGSLSSRLRLEVCSGMLSAFPSLS